MSLPVDQLRDPTTLFDVPADAIPLLRDAACQS
jgi:hypothetical protein